MRPLAAWVEAPARAYASVSALRAAADVTWRANVYVAAAALWSTRGVTGERGALTSVGVLAEAARARNPAR